MSRGDHTWPGWVGLVLGSILSVVLLVACLLAFRALHGPIPIREIGGRHHGLFLLAVLLGMVAHELIHVAGFRLVGRAPAEAARLKMIWKYLTPAAHCTVPIPARAYRIALLAPVVVLGSVPLALGLLTGSQVLAGFGAVMVALAAGDLMVWARIARVDGDVPLRDHPERMGCTVADVEPAVSRATAATPGEEGP